MLKKQSLPISRSGRKRTNQVRLALNLESLGERVLPAVSAVFVPPVGLLVVVGDAGNNAITVSRDVAGKILINEGTVQIIGGSPTVANTATISVFGRSGNDNIQLDEANGALPKAELFGGAGDDTLNGGSGADHLFGQAGNDTLLGKGGADILFGGVGNDILTGGTGNDQVFGQAGNDRMIWNNGDNTDLNEGGAGIDTVEVNGANAADQFAITPNGSRVRFDRANLVPFSIDIGTSENLVVNALGGDDTITASNGLAGLIQLTVDGGAGNDTITGGDGNDMLFGGDGNDVLMGGAGNDILTGGTGNDQVFGQAGNDRMIWNNGDNTDLNEGGAGIDTVEVNGANAADQFAITPNGSRVRFDRANLVPFSIDIGTSENLVVNALGGDDVVTASNGLAPLIHLTVNGGAGNDSITGGDGNDMLLGGDGDDVLIGGAGIDVLDGGAGNNILIQ